MSQINNKRKNLSDLIKKENNMKTINRMRNTSGNSLAEFAVVIALMATLMSTGQVKFSQAGEGGKGKKVGEELDKIGKAANNFYNAMNDEEGAGRFPGQDKWDRNVPNGAKPSAGVAMTEGQGFLTLDDALDAVEAMTSYTQLDNAENSGAGMNWCSVFGKSLEDFEIDAAHTNKIQADDAVMAEVLATLTTEEIAAGKHVGATEFSAYVDPVSSPFLDGHFIYTVIGGTVSTSPAMVITDFYAPADEFVVVQP